MSVVSFITGLEYKSSRSPSPASTKALARAVAEIEIEARLSAFRSVKVLARNYIRRPELLNRVHRGASYMPLPLFYARLRMLMRRSSDHDSCLLPMINLRAALLAVRYMIAKENYETAMLEMREDVFRELITTVGMALEDDQ